MLRDEGRKQAVRKGDIKIQQDYIVKASLEAIIDGQRTCQEMYSMYGVRPSRSGKAVSEGRKRTARAQQFDPFRYYEADDLDLREYDQCVGKARERIEEELYGAHRDFPELYGKDRIRDEVRLECRHLIKLASHALPDRATAPSKLGNGRSLDQDSGSHRRHDREAGEGGTGGNQFNAMMKDAFEHLTGPLRGAQSRDDAAQNRVPQLGPGGAANDGGWFKGGGSPRRFGFPR